MSPDTEPTPTPLWMIAVGWIITVLPALALIASGTVKVLNAIEPPPNLGWSETAFFGLGIIEIGCTVLYLFPRTALLGAILLTGYLGGAVATHVRIGDQFFPPIIIGVLAWFGLLLRDERVRALLPWRRPSSAPATGGFLAACGKILLTLVVLVGIIAGLIAAHPAEYRLERSTTIDASPSEVFAHVNDFHKWKPWNPWPDADTKITIEGPPEGQGAIYKWSGEKVGEGTMTLTESRPNELIHIKLDFAKPMANTADSDFTFKAKGDKTEVTWSMYGKHDFVGKALWTFLGAKMVGDKYAEGLTKMKAVVEAKKEK